MTSRQETRPDRITGFNADLYASRRIDLRESRVRKVRRLAAEDPPGLLLDIGCGDGGFALLLAKAGWKVCGLELSPAAAAEASRKGLKVIVSDTSQGLPFRTASFDCVLAGEIIEHLIDTDLFVSEIYRVVRNGGSVILTTPNLASLENRLRILLGLYPIWVNYRLEAPGHVRAYTPSVLKRQLRDHGFRVERHLGNWVPFFPQRFVDDVKCPWLALTGDFLPGLSMDIILKARKP